MILVDDDDDNKATKTYRKIKGTIPFFQFSLINKHHNTQTDKILVVSIEITFSFILFLKINLSPKIC